MNKRVIAGIASGLVLTELLFAVQPEHAAYYYIAVLIGSMVASWIASRLFAGLVVAGYVLVWKTAGVALMATSYGMQTIYDNMLTYFVDDLLVLLASSGGAWLGVFIRQFKLVRKDGPDPV